MALTTDDQIEIDVHDDAAALARLFSLPVAARLEALAEMQGISAFDKVGTSRLTQTHETGDGFRISVDDPRLLCSAWSLRTPGADLASRLADRLQPHTDRRVRRPRARAHAGVPASWSRGRPNVETSFNLAEWVIHEGLAEVFTVEVCSADSTGASYAGVTGAELDAAFERVTAAFDTGNGFSDWSPYGLGDLVAARMGARPVGVPHMGGYAVGRRIVERYLEASGLRAGQAIARPATEILAGAGVPISRPRTQ